MSIRIKKFELGEFYVCKRTGEIGRCVDHPWIVDFYPVMDFPNRGDYICYHGLNGVPLGYYHVADLRKATRSEIVEFLS